MSDVAQATTEATHWGLVRVKYAFQNISAWKRVLQKIMLHVKHDFQNICVRKRVLQKIMLHVKRVFQYISLRKRVLHKDVLYATYVFYHFTKLNRRQWLGDGMICLRVGKWFEGKGVAGVMCLVYLLHSGKRCRCFKCFGVFISPQTRDSFDVQIEVNSLKKKKKKKKKEK